MANHCEIKFDKIVQWTILKKNIQKQLIGNLNKDNRYTGLLYLDYEAAGDIDFENTNCKLEDSEKICDKITKKDLNYKKGSSDSVQTPNAIINFHTHPLSCYLEAETIWGWPSGEDLARGIEFALTNNVFHIVFAVEGTYIMDVNKILLNQLQLGMNKSGLENKIIEDIIFNIEKIFQVTHKHRMYYNDNNNNITLEQEFYLFFMMPMKIKKQSNIVFDWISLVNSLNIKKLIQLGQICQRKLGSEFILRDLTIYNIPDKISKLKIYNIAFIQNNTQQWNTKFKHKDVELFNYMKSHQYNLKIDLPSTISYKAAFISDKCKL